MSCPDATAVAELQPTRLFFLRGRSRVGVRHVAEGLPKAMAELLIAEAESPTAAEGVEAGLAPRRDAGVVVEGEEPPAHTPTLPFTKLRRVDPQRDPSDGGPQRPLGIDQPLQRADLLDLPRNPVLLPATDRGTPGHAATPLRGEGGIAPAERAAVGGRIDVQRTLRYLRHDVDHAAEGLRPVNDRKRSLHDLDVVDTDGREAREVAILEHLSGCRLAITEHQHPAIPNAANGNAAARRR